MKHSPFRTVRANRGLLILLATVLIMGVAHYSVGHQLTFLNLYFLPVLLGAYGLGRRKGVFTALLAFLIASIVMFTNQQQYPGTQPELWMRSLDFAIWGEVLVLTAYLVGSLTDQKQRRFAEIHRAHEAVHEIMIKFVDSVDRDTRTHSSRVADYSVEIARTMGLSKNDVEDVRVGAWFHDIGRMPSIGVLRMAAGSTPAEIEEMQRYEGAADSERSSAGILRRVISMVTSHHERWDGTGTRYLKGDEIPLGARIIAVANTFDTIVTDGPYRVSKSHEEAIKAIQRERGQAFDPHVVDAFLKHRILSTEEVAVPPRTYIRGVVELDPAATRNGSEKLGRGVAEHDPAAMRNGSEKLGRGVAELLPAATRNGSERLDRGAAVIRPAATRNGSGKLDVVRAWPMNGDQV